MNKSNTPYVVIAEAIFKSEHISDLNNILLIVFLLFIVNLSTKHTLKCHF